MPRVDSQYHERQEHMRAVQHAYPGCEVQEFEEQGHCSYTLLVSFKALASVYRAKNLHMDRHSEGATRPAVIVQIRSMQHTINLDIAQTAKLTYSHLAPSIKSLELQLPALSFAYEMEKMRGTPLSRLLPRSSELDEETQRKQQMFIVSFAAFIAQGWQTSPELHPGSGKFRADSPMQIAPEMLSQCMGRVGSSIIRRLEKLAAELPDEELRQHAKDVLSYVTTMDDFPVMLTHGDLIPSNILVDESTWEITGIVDWAEAEYLPFGTCLLREHFWHCLLDARPQIGKKQEDVLTMRDMGVLLWYGYAWDDGAIHRVVNETDDANEVACLRAFLHPK
ncbi:hypothetical protein EK21DRAFT_101520 [Setomelanomma holmii]|uniref:Aminoglycoside phosphotransferase domain-containing protein n=1 Tax=Setomelanomma holmii TaxID=210430 RepID=A0A9P4LLR3_9PLEO|nr:hypothetical protein EK21DRAFT_101520 [Setomelanomma holmii]